MLAAKSESVNKEEAAVLKLPPAFTGISSLLFQIRGDALAC